MAAGPEEAGENGASRLWRENFTGEFHGALEMGEDLSRVEF